MSAVSSHATPDWALAEISWEQFTEAERGARRRSGVEMAGRIGMRRDKAVLVPDNSDIPGRFLFDVPGFAGMLGTTSIRAITEGESDNDDLALRDVWP
jgi:hypothetical protein